MKVHTFHEKLAESFLSQDGNLAQDLIFLQETLRKVRKLKDERTESARCSSEQAGHDGNGRADTNACDEPVRATDRSYEDRSRREQRHPNSRSRDRRPRTQSNDRRDERRNDLVREGRHRSRSRSRSRSRNRSRSRSRSRSRNRCRSRSRSRRRSRGRSRGNARGGDPVRCRGSPSQSPPPRSPPYPRPRSPRPSVLTELSRSRSRSKASAGGSALNRPLRSPRDSQALVATCVTIPDERWAIMTEQEKEAIRKLPLPM